MNLQKAVFGRYFLVCNCDVCYCVVICLFVDGFIVQLCEAYEINVILPFVVFMCRDFGIRDDLIGLYSGLLTATYALTQFLSSYGWGWISDHYGRRNALLIGTVASTFAFIVFGMSKSYPQAIIAR